MSIKDIFIAKGHTEPLGQLDRWDGRTEAPEDFAAESRAGHHPEGRGPMNPFTKGRKVRAVRDTKSLGAETPIEKGEVLEVSRTSRDESGVLFNAARPDGGEYALVKADFEPEPKWKSSTVAIVTPSMYGGIVNRALRGTDGGWYTEAGGHWDDDEVTDVHELIVIDPATVDVDALVAAAHTDPVLYGDTTPDQMRAAALRMLAVIGIEVAR